MCLPRTGRWVDPLRQTLRRVYEPTTRKPIPWLLAGEAALALQGVDIDPAAVEFRAMSPFAVAYFAGFMRPFDSPSNAATVIYKQGGEGPPSESWRSNPHQRIVSWSAGERAWCLARWNVDGLPVEVIHAGGESASPLSTLRPGDMRRVQFDGMDVAVVPVEFMLASSELEGNQQATNRILHALRSVTYDAETLQRALSILPSDRAMRLMRLLEIRLVAG